MESESAIFKLLIDSLDTEIPLEKESDTINFINQKYEDTKIERIMGSLRSIVRSEVRKCLEVEKDSTNKLIVSLEKNITFLQNQIVLKDDIINSFLNKDLSKPRYEISENSKLENLSIPEAFVINTPN